MCCDEPQVGENVSTATNQCFGLYRLVGSAKCVSHYCANFVQALLACGR